MNHWKIGVWCIQLSHTLLRGRVAGGLLEAEGHCSRFQLHLSGTPISDRNTSLREEWSWQPQGRFRVKGWAPDCCLPNRSQESKACGATRQATFKVAAHRGSADTWHRDDLWKLPGTPTPSPMVLAQELLLSEPGTQDTPAHAECSQAVCGNRIRTSAYEGVLLHCQEPLKPGHRK